MRLVIELDAVDPVRFELTSAELDTLTDRIGMKPSKDPRHAAAVLEEAYNLGRLGRWLMDMGFDMVGHPVVPFIDARQFQGGDRLFGVPVRVDKAG